MSAALSARAPRPLILAFLAGGLVTHLLGAMLIDRWMYLSNAAIAPQPAWTLTGYAEGVYSTLTQLALVGIPCLILFAGMTTVSEHRRARALATWLVTGLIAASPMVLIVWVLMNLGDCFDRCARQSASDYLGPLLWIYGVALLGAAIAHAVRHRWL